MFSLGTGTEQDKISTATSTILLHEKISQKLDTFKKGT